MWSFADKALRSPTGDGALFHRVPPGGTRPVWPEVGRLKMWQGRGKGENALPSWRAVIRPAY